MAINVRIPDDLDARLEKTAAELHTSKSALLLQGARLIVERHDRRAEIGEGLDAILGDDAELIERLADA